MKNLLTIFRREFSAYFNSAIATIFLIVFLIFTNGLFMLQFFQVGRADMRGFFNVLPFVLNIFVPAIAMRLWTEDKKGNTFELLLTFPMKPYQLVLGKFLASFVFYLFALVTTLTIPLMLHWIGAPEPGHIIGGYLGLVLVGGAFLAIGIFVSGLCKDQIVAFILTALACFAIFFAGTDLFAAFLDGWVSGLGMLIKSTLGMATHVVGFSKGVIDLRDILYFLILIVIFLFLNGLSLEGRYRPKAKWVFSGAVLVCLVSITLVNGLIRDLSLGRFDVTEGQAYTVSDTSATILKNLKAPVQVKLYISPVDGMPTTLKMLERDIVDKLEELRVASDNKLKYRVIPVENSAEGEGDEFRKSLQGLGVVPFQVESIQKDEVGVKLIFSTLVIEYKEKPNEIIPRVLPQTTQDLEYQLLSRIQKMTLEEKPKIAVLAPVKQEELSSDLSQVLKDQKDIRDDFKTATLLMRNNGYDTSRINLTKESGIPESTRMLMLLNPQSLNDRQRYEINQYLYQGGTVLLAAQAFEYTFDRKEKGLEAVPEKINLDINRLIEKWGVKINDQILFDENSQVISLTTGQTVGPFALQMPVKFPNQIIVDEAYINRSVPITSRIPSIGFLWGSALEISENAMKQMGLKSTVLFTSTPKSWKISNDGSTPLTLENTKTPTQGLSKFPLAVLVEGQFSDTYEAPPAWPGDEAVASQDQATDKKMKEGKPGRLLVIGCSKAFSEDLIQNPGNLNLFANIVDGLTLGDDLVKIRSKAAVTRDIKKLSNAEKLKYKFFTIILVPLFLVVVAVIKFILRKKEKEFYTAALRAKADSA